MHLAGEAIPTQPFVTASLPVSSPVQQPSILAQYKVIRRNGAVVAFEPSKISVAMTKAFLAVSGGQGAASARIRELVAQLTGEQQDLPTAALGQIGLPIDRWRDLKVSTRGTLLGLWRPKELT